MLYTPVEAAHVIAACENRLLAAKIIDRPFSGMEIHGGVLKEHLTMEDYRAPLKVSIFMPFYPLPCSPFKLVATCVAIAKRSFVLIWTF